MSTAASGVAVPGGRWRAWWLKTLHRWHWISAAICLVGMLGFALTGITLNHAGQIKASPRVETLQVDLPAELRARLQALDVASGEAPLPPELQAWLSQQWNIQAVGRLAEWSEDEVYLSLPRPGGDGWVAIDRLAGEAEYETTDRGWVAYFNDLHKGRHAGTVWSWFIDLFAVACVIFSLTGLFLLQIHAARRPGTWPLVMLGLVLPLLLALLFIH